MARLLGYIHGDSLFHRLDPRAKLALALTVLLLCFIFNQSLHLAIVFVSVLLIWIYVKAPLSLIRTLLMIMCVFAVFIIVLQGLFWAGPTKTPFIDLVPGFLRQGWIAQVLGEASDPARSLVLSKEGVSFGFMLTLRLGAILSIMPLISLITPVKDLSMGLQKLGAPWQIAYLVMTTFRFIPVLTNQVNTILNAQKLRGLEVEKANLIRRITSYAPLAVPVILGAFRDSQQLEMVLECRGFSASGERTSYYEIKWSRLDSIAVVILVVLLVVALLVRFNILAWF